MAYPASSDSKLADSGEKILIGKGEQPAWLTLALANRHGLVTCATGTGKTVSLQVMAEGFARAVSESTVITGEDWRMTVFMDNPQHPAASVRSNEKRKATA